MHRGYGNDILMQTGQLWHKQRQTGQWMKIEIEIEIELEIEIETETDLHIMVS